jgi:hypothetical protein
MVTPRSLTVLRMFALMAERRGRTAHDRLRGRLDRSVDEARELCDRAQDLCPDGAIADAFQTALSRPARDWLRRAEALAGTVRTGSDTICGTRAQELRTLIDAANLAVMRQPTGREAWRGFYRSVLALAKPAQKDGK